MNPYLQDSANAITQQSNRNLFENILPQINSSSILNGAFGGSRQGIAQGLAVSRQQDSLNNALANQSLSAWDSDQNRATQQAMQGAQLAAQQHIAEMQNQTSRDLGFGNLGLGFTQAGNQYSLGLGQLGLGLKQADNQYSLGLGQLGLGLKQADNQYDLGMRAADTNQYGAETSRGLGFGSLGLQANNSNFNNALAGYNAQLNGLNAMNNWNTSGVNLANQQQQWPLQYLSSLTNLGTSIGGMGGTNTTPYYGNPILGGLGGALGGAKLSDWFNKSGG